MRFPQQGNAQPTAQEPVPATALHQRSNILFTRYPGL